MTTGEQDVRPDHHRRTRRVQPILEPGDQRRQDEGQQPRQEEDEQDRREAAQDADHAIERAAGRSRGSRAPGTGAASGARAGRCRRPGVDLDLRLGHGRAPGPMPTAARTSAIVASRIGRTLAAPAASVSSTTPGRRRAVALLAHRPEVLDDPLGQQLLRVDAPGARRALAVLDLEVVAAEEPMQLAHVADLRPARIGALDALGSVTMLITRRRISSGSAKIGIVLSALLLIFVCPSMPSTVGASVKTGSGSGKIGP